MIEHTAEASSLESLIEFESGDIFHSSGVASAEDWRKALDKVLPAVVVVRITCPKSFDTESAGCSHATGFIVDKERGIILTNRHVVKPGPAVFEAVFLNREEISVRPLYRDPVHDFGFLRFDPKSVRFMNLMEVPLAPDAAHVGLEIRVVGNDSGEKLSILSGTIARLDRDAPTYSKKGYNDFNTFYMQAASGTKGGSSGSPVVDCFGRAVAINAGSKSSGSAAFYLPLDRIVRALDLLKCGGGDETIGDRWTVPVVPRGTLQMTLLHKGFDETRRLGLALETEEMVRALAPAGETGMLVVDSVVPQGPAFDHIEPGDVLVRVNGKVVTRFLELEILLDENVGKYISLEFDRSGKTLNPSLLVQDLHLITPTTFVELGGGIFHALSYQQARNFRFPCGLAYVAEPGFVFSRAGVPKYAILESLDGKETKSADEFLAAYRGLPPGGKAPVEFRTHGDRHRLRTAIVTVDRHEWYGPPAIYVRDDTTGMWNVTGQSEPSTSRRTETEGEKMGNDEEVKEEEEEGSGAHGNEAHVDGDEIQEEGLPEEGGGACEALPSHLAEHLIRPSLVMLDVHLPHCALVDGVHSQHFSGTGLVLHHDGATPGGAGLVVADRNTVAVALADITLTFAGHPVEVPGDVVFLHPMHNFAIVSYDPKLLTGAPPGAIAGAKLLPESKLSRGDSVFLAGLSRSQQVTSRRSVVTNPSAVMRLGKADTPRFRAINQEVIEIDTDFGQTFSGALADKNGGVYGLYGSFSSQVKYNSGVGDHQFSRGIHIRAISAVAQRILRSRQLAPSSRHVAPPVRLLEAEIGSVLLSKARHFGLGENWVQLLASRDPIRRQALQVVAPFAGSRANQSLRHGDLLLAVGGQPITGLADLEEACDRLEGKSGAASWEEGEEEEGEGVLELTVFRKGQEIQVSAGTNLRDGFGTNRVVHWAGCVLHATHGAVRALGFLPPHGHGVYISRWNHGSPAHRYGLFALHWIVEINSHETPTMDAFLQVTKGLKHGTFVRVKVVHLNGKPKVVTLKLDLHYWPTWQLKYCLDSGKWKRKVLTYNPRVTEIK